MATTPTLLWLRRDLRLADHPALAAALSRGGSVVPVYVWAPQEDGRWAPGAASRWWLHHSLEAFARDAAAAGSPLVIRAGSSLEVLAELAEETGAGAVYWNRRYEPVAIENDRAVKAGLSERGLEVRSFNASLLHEPWEVANGSGDPYRVFTPFWKSCLAKGPPASPLEPPRRIQAPDEGPRGLSVDDLGLLPKIDWTSGLAERWSPGEAGARERLERFVGAALPRYAKDRDRPDRSATSELSPHLHHGEIGPRQIWHAVRRAEAAEGSSDATRGAEKYLAEVGWREFAHHLLYHFPKTPVEPLRGAFADFPWREDRKGLRAWQRGRTGFPLVDAGMRELWGSGVIHNRVRMVVASFLVKDLLVPWQKGAEWFWDTLVDADLASNTLGWQWVAGCGADAAPYFRVFNPVGQGKKFDPEGTYVRAWVPELASLPDRYIHAPWDAPDDVLDAAGVRLGRTYPAPIVDHAVARRRALDAYELVKAG